MSLQRHLLFHESDELRLLGVAQHFMLGLVTSLLAGFVLLRPRAENKRVRNQLIRKQNDVKDTKS